MPPDTLRYSAVTLNTAHEHVFQGFWMVAFRSSSKPTIFILSFFSFWQPQRPICLLLGCLTGCSFAAKVRASWRRCAAAAAAPAAAACAAAAAAWPGACISAAAPAAAAPSPAAPAGAVSSSNFGMFLTEVAETMPGRASRLLNHSLWQSMCWLRLPCPSSRKSAVSQLNGHGCERFSTF